jgi:hypothetical protein
MNNDTRKTIETAAWTGGLMPEGLTAPEQVYYHGLWYIFHAYRIKSVDAETTKDYCRSLRTEVEQLEEEVKAHG